MKNFIANSLNHLNTILLTNRMEAVITRAANRRSVNRLLHSAEYGQYVGTSTDPQDFSETRKDDQEKNPRYLSSKEQPKYNSSNAAQEYYRGNTYGDMKVGHSLDHSSGNTSEFRRNHTDHFKNYQDYFKSYNSIGDFRSLAYLQKMKNVGDRQPLWKAKALINGNSIDFDSTSLLGRWVILFFYPLNFTFVCPTEIHEASDMAEEFRRVNAEIIGVSVDSIYSHRAWSRISRDEGGVSGLNIILVSDLDRTLVKRFGVISKANPAVANRATFIINPEGIICHTSVNESSVGRSFVEILRLLKGLQYTAQNGEVCPAKWKEGERGFNPTPESYSEWYENTSQN